MFKDVPLWEFTFNYLTYLGVVGELDISLGPDNFGGDLINVLGLGFFFFSITSISGKSEPFVWIRRLNLQSKSRSKKATRLLIQQQTISSTAKYTWIDLPEWKPYSIRWISLSKSHLAILFLSSDVFQLFYYRRWQFIHNLYI